MNMHNLVKLNISVVSSCSDTVSHAMDSDVLVEITCSFCAISVSFLVCTFLSELLDCKKPH